MFVSTQNLHIEILMSDVMVLEGGAFEMYFGHEGGTLMSRISTPTKEMPEWSLAPLPYEGTIRSLRPRDEPSPDHAGPFIFNFQPPES